MDLSPLNFLILPLNAIGVLFAAGVLYISPLFFSRGVTAFAVAHLVFILTWLFFSVTALVWKGLKRLGNPPAAYLMISPLMSVFVVAYVVVGPYFFPQRG